MQGMLKNKTPNHHLMNNGTFSFTRELDWHKTSTKNN